MSPRSGVDGRLNTGAASKKRQIGVKSSSDTLMKMNAAQKLGRISTAC